MCVGCQIAVNFHGADCLSFCRKLLIFRKDLSTLFTLYNKMYLMGLELQVPRRNKSFRYLSGKTGLLDQATVVSVSQNLSLSWPVIMQKWTSLPSMHHLFLLCCYQETKQGRKFTMCVSGFLCFLSKKLQCLVNRAGSLYSLWTIV